MPDIFVCGNDGSNPPVDVCYCARCIPEGVRSILGDSDVDTWEYYSHGFTGAPVCSVCKLSVPVYVDGNGKECEECGVLIEGEPLETYSYFFGKAHTKKVCLHCFNAQI